MVDLFLGELGCDVGHYHRLELNKSKATLEKLVKLRIFLKSRVSLLGASCLVIHG